MRFFVFSKVVFPSFFFFTNKQYIHLYYDKQFGIYDTQMVWSLVYNTVFYWVWYGSMTFQWMSTGKKPSKCTSKLSLVAEQTKFACPGNILSTSTLPRKIHNPSPSRTDNGIAKKNRINANPSALPEIKNVDSTWTRTNDRVCWTGSRCASANSRGFVTAIQSPLLSPRAPRIQIDCQICRANVVK